MVSKNFCPFLDVFDIKTQQKKIQNHNQTQNRAVWLGLNALSLISEKTSTGLNEQPENGEGMTPSVFSLQLNKFYKK